MAVIIDFSLGLSEDGVLTVGMSPPTAIGAWRIQYQMWNRFGGVSGLVTKNITSGYNGVSGITIVNSGQGIMSINLPASDLVGLNLDPKNYAYKVTRLDSGFATTLAEGYRTMGTY